MPSLTQKQIAAENTYTFSDQEGEHYLCYICGQLLNPKKANIDHIKAISCFSQAEKSKPTFRKYGTSFNIGLGVVKEKWLKYFSEKYWFYNNLVLTHKKCNNEDKDNQDFTRYYIDWINE